MLPDYISSSNVFVCGYVCVLQDLKEQEVVVMDLASHLKGHATTLTFAVVVCARSVKHPSLVRYASGVDLSGKLTSRWLSKCFYCENAQSRTHRAREASRS